jgi:hypothetical protein
MDSFFLISSQNSEIIEMWNNAVNENLTINELLKVLAFGFVIFKDLLRT